MKPQLFTTVDSLSKHLISLRNEGIKVGFIPTMGALHEGHLSLVKLAQINKEYPVVSIFVNPKQFNNQVDLEKYPRTIEKDLDLLSNIGVETVFCPSILDVYPENYVPLKLDLGLLDKVMEGEFRPGHFDGVVAVVNRLFEIVKPSTAYLGRKDFQQVAVLKYMIKATHSNVRIQVGETLRDPSGLAKSSRNERLDFQQLHDATGIIYCLNLAKLNAQDLTPDETKRQFISDFKGFNSTLKNPLRLEYFQIIDPVSLQPLTKKWLRGATACIAAFCGDVRLIDNLELISNEE